VFIVKTAFVRSVKPVRPGIAAVEKFSAQPFIEGPTKSKTAAKRADQVSTRALWPPRLPATRISVVARASG
jgi:hypothetical protein